MGMIYVKFLYCHGVAEVNEDKKIQHWSIKTGRFMNASIIHLQIT